MHSVGKTSNQQSCTTINRGRTVRIQVTQANVERPLSKDDSSGSAAHGGRGHASCSTDPHLVISPTRPLSPRIPWNCGDERAAAVRVPSRTWTLTANNRVTTGTRRAGTVARHRAVFLVPWRSAACLARVVGTYWCHSFGIWLIGERCAPCRRGRHGLQDGRRNKAIECRACVATVSLNVKRMRCVRTGPPL